MSYYFIENKDDKQERRFVAFRLHLLVLIIGFAVGMICTALSPMTKTGELSIGLGFLYNMMWIPFFWGFMFTGFMVKPPKKGRFLYLLPRKGNAGGLCLEAGGQAGPSLPGAGGLRQDSAPEPR